jgi:glycosyltransferase involved in cell wall biosynthesis
MNTLWIDATFFHKRKLPFSGIPRVEAELIKWAQNNLHALKFFRYNPSSQCFTELEQLSFPKLSAPAAPTNLILKPSPDEVKISLKSLYHSVRSFLNVKYRSDVNSYLYKMVYKLKKIYSAFKKQQSQPSMAVTEPFSVQNTPASRGIFPFKKGDSILFAGTVWEYASIIEELALIKKQIKLSIYLICHDLIPAKFPHLCLQIPGVSLEKKFLPYLVGMAKISDRIFCVSQSTESDYKKFAEEMGLASLKTLVIREGSHIVLPTANQPPSAMIQELLKTEFVIFVSTIEKRKNHECIYKAILYLLEKDFKNLPKFVFVGGLGWSVNDFLSDLKFDSRVQDYIVLMHGTTDDDLRYLYEKALFTLYPSYYEGWGLPIAEALNYGKMVLASSTSSMPEVGGDFADYIHPYDTINWAERIAFYLNNRDELAKKEKYIRENYKKNSWEDFCKQIFNNIMADE